MGQLDGLGEYKGDIRATLVRPGRVRWYDSATNTYRVDIHRVGSKVCRALKSGINSPYSNGDKVLLIQSTGADWVIIGELDKPTPTTAEADSSDTRNETVADTNNQLVDLPVTDGSYRPVTDDNIKTPVWFSGDRAIKSVGTPTSEITLYNIGDIIVRASYICYIFLRKETNSLYLRATSFITECFGYKKTIEASTSSLTAGELSIVETVKALPTLAPKRVDKLTKTGTIRVDPMLPNQLFSSQPVAVRGERVEYAGHLTVEIDNDSSTLRLEQRLERPICQLTIGSFAKENTKTARDLPIIATESGPVPQGVSIRLGDDYSIIYDQSKAELIIFDQKLMQNKIHLSKEQLSLGFGGQYMTLNASGLSVAANSVTFTTPGVVSVNSSVTEINSITNVMGITTITGATSITGVTLINGLDPNLNP